MNIEELAGMVKGDWTWVKNARSKYLSFTVDMRSGQISGLQDRDGVSIDEMDVRRQLDKIPPQPPLEGIQKEDIDRMRQHVAVKDKHAILLKRAMEELVSMQKERTNVLGIDPSINVMAMEIEAFLSTNHES